MPILLDLFIAGALIVICAGLIWLIHFIVHFCDKHIPDTPIMPKAWTGAERRKRSRETLTHTNT